jgi:NADH-quinone oxidoreductase subunit L
LIIGGAIGKSAQVPLQTWLPDAMAGPTPVSALIHAATMVTAGVYLIARMHSLFILSREAMFAVAVIGAVTLLYSGFSAMVQRDIKRVLAYSTISQIGYMFLALGVGAWTGAIFHFFTHAFFKALLFLSAGIVIDAQRHEHDIFKMGGLKSKLPVAYWTFVIGAGSLSALPFVTAGFYSKDAIIWAGYSSPFGGMGFLVAALIGALITSIYSFRVVYLVFFGEQKMEVTKQPGRLMSFAVIVLAFLSIAAGFLSWPESIVSFNPFAHFAASAFPGVPETFGHNIIAEDTLIAVSSILALLGIYTAWLYFKNDRWARVVERSPVLQAIHRFFYVGWGFDWLYDKLLVRPFMAITTWNRNDIVDSIYTGLAGATELGNRALSATQTGRVRNYAAGIVLGAVIMAIIILVR